MKNQKTNNKGESPPQFLDRKITTDGGSRVIRFSKFIPEGWQYVRIFKLSEKNECIVLAFQKLLGINNHAQTPPTNQKHKQNP